MCWKGKRETRLGKSEKSVGKVLKPLKQNVQKCTVSKFFIQIRKCIKAQRKGWRYQRADRKGPVLFLCSHRETWYNTANIVHLQLVCIWVWARQTVRVREKESRWGGVYWLHIVYSLSTGWLNRLRHGRRKCVCCDIPLYGGRGRALSTTLHDRQRGGGAQQQLSFRLFFCTIFCTYFFKLTAFNLFKNYYFLCKIIVNWNSQSQQVYQHSYIKCVVVSTLLFNNNWWKKYSDFSLMQKWKYHNVKTIYYK